jgi:2-haloacid dehalogenase
MRDAHSAIIAFDAYGTLFDVHAAATRHRDAIGPAFDRLSQVWRAKHLEYTWIHAQTGRPISFWVLAERSLDFAITTVGGVPAGVREALLSAYRRMDPFAEVPEVLAALKARGARLAILTNGDRDMIADAVAAARLDGMFDAVLSVEDAGVFKPAAAVYRLVTERLACQPAEVTFVSMNRWDVAGGAVFGFDTVWVNRAGMPDEYPDMPARRIIADLRALLD